MKGSFEFFSKIKTKIKVKRSKTVCLKEKDIYLYVFCVLKSFLVYFLFSVCKSALRKLRDIFEHTSFFKNYDVLDILQV